MSLVRRATRTPVWMETLGEWSWPGTASASAEVLPPPWVPASPPRLETVVGDPLATGSWQPQRSLTWRLGVWTLLSALAALAALTALRGPVGLERLVGYRGASAPPPARILPAPRALAALTPLPRLLPVSRAGAGSLVERASYRSIALREAGSFYVYLPPGYAGASREYPVLYLLHGNSQLASSFLQIGLQRELDRLISAGVIPPMIAVMIQGGPGANNWRDWGRRNYASYVVEVQELVDRMLPTVATRGGRAIAGESMGGYGAMNVALGNPDRFAVVESWLGFFNGLDGNLRADRPILARLGLHAFLYGAAADRIASPAQNAPFAAALRAAGASAVSAVYPGEHTLGTVQAHLGGMLTYAGRTLASTTAQLAGSAAH